MELVNTIVAMKLLSQSTTTTKLLHLTHTAPTHALTTTFIRTSNKNGVTCIYSYIKNIIKVYIHRSSNKIRINHIGITQFGHNHVGQLI
jgi:hypothetical protein